MADFLNISGSSLSHVDSYSFPPNTIKLPEFSETQLIDEALNRLEEDLSKKPLDERESTIRSFFKKEVAEYFTDKITLITNTQDISAATEALFATIEHHAPRMNTIAKQAIDKETLIIRSEDILTENTSMTSNINIDLLDPELAESVKKVVAENISSEIVEMIKQNNTALQIVLEKLKKGEDLTKEDLKLLADNDNLLQELKQLAALFKDHALQVTLEDNNGKLISLDQMISLIAKKQQDLITEITSLLQTSISEQIIENQNTDLGNLHFYEDQKIQFSETTNKDLLRLKNSVLTFKTLIINSYKQTPEKLREIMIDIKEYLPESELKNTIISTLNNSVEIALRYNLEKTKTIENINYLKSSVPEINDLDPLSTAPQPLNNGPENILQKYPVEPITEFNELQRSTIIILTKFQPFIKKAINDLYSKNSKSVTKFSQEDGTDKSSFNNPEIKSGDLPKVKKVKDQEPTSSNKFSEMTRPRQFNEFTDSEYLLRESLSILENIFENPAEIVKYDFEPKKFEKAIYSIKLTADNMIRNNDVLQYFNEDTIKQMTKIRSLLNLFYIELSRINLSSQAGSNGKVDEQIPNYQYRVLDNTAGDLTRAAINSSQSIPVLAQALLEKIKALLKAILPPERSLTTTKKRKHQRRTGDPGEEASPRKGLQKENSKYIKEI